MIENMSLENFKAWESLPAARFAKLTGFFGLNSAGKSSLIQLLLLLKQTVESADRTLPLNLGDERDPRTLVNLGTFRDLVFGHDETREVRFNMQWRPREEIRVRNIESLRGHARRFSTVRLTAAIGLVRGRMSVSDMTYELDDYKLSLHRNEGKYELGGSLERLGLKKSPGRKWDFPSPTKCYGFPDRVRTDFQNPELFLDLEQALETFFIKELFYLGPLRYQPERSYTWSGSRPEDVGHQGENVIAALLGSREMGAYISPGKWKQRKTLEERVAYWLKTLDLVSDFRLREMAAGSNRYVVEVRTSESTAWVGLPDVGFGVSQVLPVLALCYYVPEGSTVILEHPEIHLHPSAQTGLADVLLDVVQNRNVQVIVESHSEHFLRRLQRRVASGRISNKDIALYFCDRTKSGSRISELAVNVFGEISNWPDKFFGDQLGEVFAIHEEGLNQKVRARNAS